MKKVLFIVAISSLFTGCASVGTAIERGLTPSTQLAQQDCVKMGFQFGTPRYQECVLSVSNNIRTARAISSANQPDYSAPRLPQTITCHGTGAVRSCFYN